jgi:hypothetical protein
MATEGDVSRLSLGVVTVAAETEFGAESGEVVFVAHGFIDPDATWAVQPAGSAGGVTPSKFCRSVVVVFRTPSRIV